MWIKVIKWCKIGAPTVIHKNGETGACAILKVIGRPRSFLCKPYMEYLVAAPFCKFLGFLLFSFFHTKQNNHLDFKYFSNIFHEKIFYKYKELNIHCLNLTFIQSLFTVWFNRSFINECVKCYSMQHILILRSQLFNEQAFNVSCQNLSLVMVIAFTLPKFHKSATIKIFWGIFKQLNCTYEFQLHTPRNR